MSQGMSMGGGSLMQMLMPMMGMMGGMGGGQQAQGQQGLDPALINALAGMQGGGGGEGMGMPAAAPGMAPSMTGQGGAGMGMGMAPGMMPSAATAAPATGMAPGGMAPPGMMPSSGAGGGMAPGMMPSSGQAGATAEGMSGPSGTPGAAGGMAAPEPSAMDKFLGIFSGGHDKSPEGLDTFRKYNALMAAGTALGGAIAGPGTMVGDVSKELNRFAQGNIAASNVEQQQKDINGIAKGALGSLGGPGAGTGTKLAGAGKGKGGAFDAPINAPQGGGGAFGGISPMTAQTLSLDDLDKQLSSLNIAF